MRNAFIAASSSQAVMVQKALSAERKILPLKNPPARSVWRTICIVRQTNCGK
jgi:hypothetical protein